MKRQLKNISKARIKRSNVNTFLFFLLFAVVIWIFVQFSKQYDEIIEIPVAYVNVPPDKLITEDNPKTVKLRLEKTGFRIAWKSLFPPTLAIDVQETSYRDGKLLYVIDDHREEIMSQLDINFEDSEFVKEVIEINFQQKKEKRLPVVNRIDVEYAPGYSATKGVQLEPDSVTVSGPDNILDTISQLLTEKMTLKKVKASESGIVRLDTAGLGALTFYETALDYRLEVEKFTEGKVVVPIELTDVPAGTNVVIFPKETVLFYQVNLQDYNSVTASDFRVIADFSEVEENQDFLIPEVVKKPDFTSNVRLNEKKIHFVIKK